MRRLLFIGLGILAVAGVAWFNAGRFQTDGGYSMKATTMASVVIRETFRTALTRFRIDVGRFPATGEGLLALRRCPIGCKKIWKGPYVDIPHDAIPPDPWGSPYQYRSPGTRNPEAYDMWSLGPDRKPSDDDIGNWKI